MGSCGLKCAERIALWIEAQGIGHVFLVSGGADLHMLHGLADKTKVRIIPTTHECNAGFAADAYARLTGFGVAMATSGPGATNLVTAIGASFYDSIPVLYLTGQVASFRRGARFGVKVYGFQETPIVEMVKPITKWAIETTAETVIRDLDFAKQIAQEGRRGPVLIDVPDDIQRMDI